MSGRRVVHLCLFALLLTALLLPEAQAMGQGGVNEVLDLDGTNIVSVEHADSSSVEGDPFQMTIEVDEEAAEDDVSVSLTWRSCLNGETRCITPETIELNASEDGRTWTGEFDPPFGHAYVTFHVLLKYPDGEVEHVPETGFGGTTWSDCWVWDDRAAEDDCPIPSLNAELDDVQVTTPAPGLLLLVTGVTSAAIAASRHSHLN